MSSLKKIKPKVPMRILSYHHQLAIAIEWLRNNEKHFTAGHNGEYGRIYFINEHKLIAKRKQMIMF